MCPRVIGLETGIKKTPVEGGVRRIAVSWNRSAPNIYLLLGRHGQHPFSVEGSPRGLAEVSPKCAMLCLSRTDTRPPSGAELSLRRDTNFVLEISTVSNSLSRG